MKLLLVDPPIRAPISRADDQGLPLGLLTLAAAIRRSRSDWQVECVSAKWLQAHGVWHQFESKQFAVDWVLITSVSADFSGAREIASRARMHGAKVLMGGLLATNAPEYVLRNAAHIDLVLRGPAEDTVVAAIEASGDFDLLSRIPGCCWRHGEHLRIGPVPSVRPAPMPPDLSSVPKGPIPAGAALGVFTSRGCTMQCRFCSLGLNSSALGRQLYPMPMVQEMIDDVVARWRPKDIRIEDETLNLDHDRFRQVLDLLSENTAGCSYRIKCRIELLSRGDFEYLRTANVSEIHCGIESASPELLAMIGKVSGAREATQFLASARRAAEQCARAGIVMNPVFLLGLPGETPATLEKTRKFVRELASIGPMKPYISFLTIHPGSHLERWTDALGVRRTSSCLDYYTHKWPVSVPVSLGQDGVKALVRTYNTISHETASQRYNPLIDENDIANILEGHCSEPL